MLKTEMRNPKTTHIDKMTTDEMIRVMCEENYNAAKAVEMASDSIAAAVEAIVASFENGGQLFFVGAGTSGRLGVLDAAECPPTFGVDHSMVNGIIAGGSGSIMMASEGAEDNGNAGEDDVVKAGVKAGDVLVGISVAGGAKYVVGAMRKAHSLGCVTISLSCNKGCLIEKESDISIFTDTGAEVITGSTRLKAGTAHKIVLNMLTTCSMVKMGYVYENMMINLKPSNIKLRRRMIGIVKEICSCEEDIAERMLDENSWSIKKAVSAFVK